MKPFAFDVSERESGSKLLAFLKSQLGPQIPARQLKRSLDAGRCRLNGRVERFGSKLVGRGDHIDFDLLQETRQELQEDSQESYLYVDDDIIAYNKSSGIISEDKKLQASIHAKYDTTILLHRLDRETSGVLLFARNTATETAMLELFKQRHIEKKYLAIVDGIPAKEGVVDNFLGKVNAYQGQTLWGAVEKEKGRWACTRWHVEKSHKDVSLLTCFPETGRTHQIRVHLSSIGHPILGDHQYGRTFRSSFSAPRLLLHAAEISFLHPTTKKEVSIKAPLPLDFEEAMEQLEL